MTDTVLLPASPVEPSGPDPISCVKSIDYRERLRFRPTLEQLECRDVPSVVVMGAIFGDGKTALFASPNPIAPLTPALACVIATDNVAVSNPAPRPTPRAAAPIRSDAVERLAVLLRPQVNMTVNGTFNSAVVGQDYAMRTVLGSVQLADSGTGFVPAMETSPVSLDGLRLVDATADTHFDVLTSGYRSAFSLTSFAGILVVVFFVLRQHQGQAGTSTNPLARSTPRRAPDEANEDKSEHDEESAWPGLDLLARDAQAETTTETLGDAVARQVPPSPLEELPDATAWEPSAPGEVHEEGCPYIAQLQAFALGTIAADSEEGLQISGHRDCPRCRHWLDFFQREADQSGVQARHMHTQ